MHIFIKIEKVLHKWEMIKFYSKLNIISDGGFIWPLKTYDSITFEKLILLNY